MNLPSSFSRLADTPKQPPIFATDIIKSSSGDGLNLSDPDLNRALIACMDMAAVLGGAASHYGGPAAFAELNSVMYGVAFSRALKQKIKWSELFHFVNDAGHCENGIYAIKAGYGFAGLELNSLKKFRSIESPLTGHGEAHLFPEGVLVSNGPLGSGVAQAQGLALADGITKNYSRTTVLSLSDGGAMEGEAKEALASIPGLAQKGRLGRFICVLSDNNTKLSGRIDEDSFPMSGSFDSLSSMGWQVLNLENGNKIEDCLHAFEKAISLTEEDHTRPVLIHAKTLKGIGTKATEESASGGHGFPVKDPKELRAFVKEILGPKAMPKFVSEWITELENFEKPSSAETSQVKKEKIQVGIASAMINAKKNDIPVLSVSCDLAESTGVASFQKQFPEASVDIGIAESNMVSVGSGLSLAGFVPIVDTFAQFGTTKGALPFIMSSLSQAPMIAVFSHIGFQDAADGASHQSLSFLALLNSIPNIETYCLSSSSQAEQLMGSAITKFFEDKKAGKTPKTYIFFLGRENFPQYYKTDTDYKLGLSQVYEDASSKEQSICLVGVGSMFLQAQLASEVLKEKGFSVSLINASCTSLVDPALLKICEQSKLSLVIEEHQKKGSYHSLVAQALAEKDTKTKCLSVSINSKFGQSAYTALDLYKAHGLDSESIVNLVQEHLS